MAYIITMITYFSNIINLFLKKKSEILTFMFCMIMWILFWGNYENPDYYNYLWGYNDIMGTIREPAYNLLSIVFYQLGFNYHVFLAFLSLIGYILIYKTINKYVKNKSYIYLLYFMYPFMLDVVQVRNFIGMAFLIYAVPFLKNNRLKGKLINIVLILLAASFQISMMAFLPFVFLSDVKFSNVMKITMFTTLLIASYVPLNPSLISGVGTFFSNLLNDQRFLNYFQRQTNYGFLLLWFAHICSFLLINYSRKAISSNINQGNTINKNETDTFSFVQLVYKLNIYSFLFFPLIILTSTFFRLNRNLSILYYIVFYLTSRRLKPRSSEKIIYNLIVILFVIILFIIEIYISYSKTIVFPIFESNLFLK